jgi:transcriptional regulator with XRE-family HTH domain
VPRGTQADPVAQAFGGALRAAREARGETLEDVAARVPRLDPRYLGEIELGWHAPTIVTCKRIADALEVPLVDLVRNV